MSLTFNDTTTYRGIIQQIESNIKAPVGWISGNTVRLKQFTADINLALDRVVELIFQHNGTWQFDDSNHTDYPFITTTLTSGQRDYPFTTDEQSNLILDIYKVMIKQGTAATDYYTEIYPVDQVTEKGKESFFSGQDATGIPYRYDKTANGIFLDPVPNYTVASGLKVFINREASYFISTDTTKKPGFAGLFHEYLALQPSYKYALRNGLKNANVLKNETLEMENQIEVYYSQRSRDEKQRIIPAYRSSR